MKTSETTAKLAEALAKAQQEIRDPVKNKTNPHFKNSYADLAACLETIRPALSNNGICVVQAVDMNDKAQAILLTRLEHSSGEWMEGEVVLGSVNEPQKFGSSLTYLRRYTLGAMVGVAPDDDDDGEATRGHKKNLRQEGNNASVRSSEAKTLSPSEEALAARRKRMLEIHKDCVRRYGSKEDWEKSLKRDFGISCTDLANVDEETASMIEKVYRENYSKVGTSG